MVWKGTMTILNDGEFSRVWAKNKLLKVDACQEFSVYGKARPIVGVCRAYVYCAQLKHVADILKVPVAREAAEVFIQVTDCDAADWRGNIIERQDTFVIDFDGPVNWEDQMKSKTKNLIRRGLRDNVLIKNITDETEVRQWYDLYSNTSNVKKFNQQPWPLIKNIIQNPHWYSLIGAYHNGELVSGMFFLRGDYPVYWLGGRRFNGESYSEFCLWSAIKQFQAEAVPLVDLGGAVLEQEHGPTKFKAQFGGQLKSVFLAGIVNNKWKHRLMPARYRRI
ncbi:MAG TPA: GNAT family N-acetyltransferase [Patescibacteria group bacterium]|nr:GNAT family N-acetyltransferase [Patescibacteria group bacterium]